MLPSPPSMLAGQAQRLWLGLLMLMHGLMSSQCIESSRLDVQGDNILVGDNGRKQPAAASGNGSDEHRTIVAHGRFGREADAGSRMSMVSFLCLELNNEAPLCCLIQALESISSSKDPTSDDSLFACDAFNRSSSEQLCDTVLRLKIVLVPSSSCTPGATAANKSWQLIATSICRKEGSASELLCVTVHMAIFSHTLWFVLATAPATSTS